MTDTITNGAPTGPRVAIIGAGPAGLMAAEWLALAGLRVTIHEAMPSPARKFLMAGRGGLNLTHGEDLSAFLSRYGDEAGWLAPAIAACPPDAIRAWSDSLGEPTFTGSSGRVFPNSFKASPLLRAWLRRLDGLGVALRLRSRWTGWDAAGRPLVLAAGESVPQPVEADATLLAMGGGSWPRLGSDAAWTVPFAAAGIPLRPIVPANAGIAISWSPLMVERFAGEPLKRIALTVGNTTLRGEAIVTRQGLEGGVVYAQFRAIREALAGGPVTIHVNLRPDLTVEALARRLAAPDGRLSLATRAKRAGLSPVAVALMREAKGGPLPASAADLAGLATAVPLIVTGTAGLTRAISSAGGVMREAVDDNLMLRAKPGTFVAGEMLDWEAPTGGYLLQASFATGASAARGILAYLGRTMVPPDWLSVAAPAQSDSASTSPVRA